MRMAKPEKVILAVTGGVAAYKAAELTRQLRAAGFAVQVMMSRSARRLIAPATFQALSGNPVLTSLWRASQSGDGMAHIALSRDARAMIVAPASANCIAKIANGIADDLPSTAALAATCPIFVAPAMNREMWAHPATRRNIARIAADGVIVVGPESGEQACGETGFGRMSEPADIRGAVCARLHNNGALAGRRVLISVGATVEAIDAMRVISNRSSGKMGFALAQAAANAGADTQIIAGQTTATPPAGIALSRAMSGEEMRTAILREAADADVFISAAAVADFRPLKPRADKPRRTSGFTLELTPTADILAEIARLPNAPFCVGFAAESGDLEKGARRKLRAKKAAMIIACDVTATVGGDDCALLIVAADGVRKISRRPKTEAAREVIAAVGAAIVSRETSAA
jgi:phosphopantothenoylcysteine decarboxylase/phosphopantothenate--cysteine ligase